MFHLQTHLIAIECLLMLFYSSVCRFSSSFLLCKSRKLAEKNWFIQQFIHVYQVASHPSQFVCCCPERSVSLGMRKDRTLPWQISESILHFFHYIHFTNIKSRCCHTNSLNILLQNCGLREMKLLFIMPILQCVFLQATATC